MDKTEYNIKLDQIQNLVEAQDIQGAAEVADTIDWRRVKSIRTLSMAADIYEANKRLEESKEILLLAYNRSSVGKTILFRLVEVCVKLDHLDEAVDYYTEYSRIARGDNSKYILKYKIYRARRAPLEEQIVILEEYKNKEYTERWSFELARLYDRVGRQDKCIEECDDLILWFSEGKYVVKALELKMKYTPLSPAQQKKYDNRQEILAEPSFVARKTVEPKAEASVIQPIKPVEQEVKGAGSPELDMVALEAAITSDDALKGLENRTQNSVFAAPSRSSSENLQEKLATSFKDVLSGLTKVKDEVAMTFAMKEDVAADSEEELEDVDEYEVVKDLEPENLGTAARAAADNTINVVEPTPVNKEPLSKEEVKEEVYVEDNLEEEETEEVFQSDIVAEEKKPTEISLEEQLKEILEESKKAEPEDMALDEYMNAKAKTEGDVQAEINSNDMAVEEVRIGDTIEMKKISVPRDLLSEEVPEDELPIKEQMLPEEGLLIKKQILPEEELPIEEQILQEETAEERRERVLQDTRPDKLSDEQKKIFSYFAKVPGIDQQLLDALHGVYCFVRDKTSKHGNIAIMGQPGTGKSRLAESIVTAICKDLGLSAAKFARTDGEKLNQKDPAKVVAKLSGGFLLIEKAGAMSSETVGKLSRALEFRTDSMIVIIEDEKSSMRRLLKEEAAFAEKFETVISIPVFTNDELVVFARQYANEMGYHIDELGVLALYTQIGEQQTEREPVTVAGVKEMVDRGIRSTQKATRKFGRKLAVRGTNEDGHVILYEKDFEL